jgi:5-methylcytosine-specific restriction endonuclease McrA
MKNHTKVYFAGMGIHFSEWVACEWCGGTCVDIHHLDPRGRGGSKQKDFIENLVGLCRSCHLKAEARTIDKEELREKHLKNIP